MLFFAYREISILFTGPIRYLPVMGIVIHIDLSII